jgi:hypothetical protein
VSERVARRLIARAASRHLPVGHRLEAISLRAAHRLDAGRLATVARRLAPRRRLAFGAQPLARGNGAEWRAQAEEVVRAFAARPVAQEHLVAGRPHGNRATAAHLAVRLGYSCVGRSRVGRVRTTSAVLHQPHRGCVRRGGGHVRHTRKGLWLGRVVRGGVVRQRARGGRNKPTTKISGTCADVPTD